MNPPALALDFANPPRAGRTLATILVLVGAVAALWAFAEYADVKEELARQEARRDDTRRLARRALPALAPQETGGREMAAEILAANVVLDQLSLDWTALFADVESAVTPDVALLTVQPDAHNRTVAVTGEARNLNALLTFLARVEATPSLADTHLTQHELRVNHPQRPLAFALKARWTPAR